MAVLDRSFSFLNAWFLTQGLKQSGQSLWLVWVACVQPPSFSGAWVVCRRKSTWANERGVSAGGIFAMIQMWWWIESGLVEIRTHDLCDTHSWPLRYRCSTLTNWTVRPFGSWSFLNSYEWCPFGLVELVLLSSVDERAWAICCSRSGPGPGGTPYTVTPHKKVFFEPSWYMWLLAKFIFPDGAWSCQ